MVEPLTWVLRIVTLDGWPCGLPAYKSDFELVALVEDWVVGRTWLEIV